jgi:phosphomannomutase
VQLLVDGGMQRPTRMAGAYHLFQGSVPYLACLLKHFHAVRPLRVAILCGSTLLERYVSELFRGLPCARIAPSQLSAAKAILRGDAARLVSETIRQSEAHVGVFLEADGERATFFDERSKPVAPEEIAALLAQRLLREHPGSQIVLEEDSPPRLLERLSNWGANLSLAPASRSAVATVMHTQQARFGAGPSGRYWFRDGVVTADALIALAGVLSALSWNDLSFSALLAQLAVE